MALLEGVAIGGPRDGAKLSCPSNWDGRILKRGPNTYFKGHYRYNAETSSWVWNDRPAELPLPPKGNNVGRPRKRKPFAGYQYGKNA